MIFIIKALNLSFFEEELNQDQTKSMKKEQKGKKAKGIRLDLQL